MSPKTPTKAHNRDIEDYRVFHQNSALEPAKQYSRIVTQCSSRPDGSSGKENLSGIYTFDSSSVQLDSKALAALSPDRVTRFYLVPSPRFAKESDVVAFHGFTMGEKIAAGGFAVVYKAYHRRTGLVAAAKVVDLSKKKTELKLSSVQIMDMKNEIYIMHRVDNQYVVKVFAHFVVNRSLYIFMRYANHGTLFKYVKKHGPLPEKTTRRLFAQILVGMDHMHGLYISHRDLKLENVLLYLHDDGKLTCLISDFGLSRVANVDDNLNWSLAHTFCGTTAYMAPEILQGHTYDPFLADIWSLGVMLYSMLNSAFPFDQSDQKTQVEQALKREWTWGTHPAFTPPSDECHNYIRMCLEPDLTLRARMGHLVRDPWITKQFLEAKKDECFPRGKFYH